MEIAQNETIYKVKCPQCKKKAVAVMGGPGVLSGTYKEVSYRLKAKLMLITVLVMLISSCSKNAIQDNNVANINNENVASSEIQTDVYTNDDLEIKDYLATVKNGETTIYYTDNLPLGKENATFTIKNNENIQSFDIQRTHVGDVNVSSDGEFIYFTQSNKNNEITVDVIDIINNTKYNLFERLNLNENEIGSFQGYKYLNGNMIVSTDKKRILIDLKNNSFRDITTDGYLTNLGEIITVGFEDKTSSWYIIIKDLEGNVKKEIKDMNVPDKGLGFSYFAPSYDGRYILFSLGSTPSSLYLCDVNNNKSYELVNGKEKIRLASNWDNDNVFYYKVMDENNKISIEKKIVRDVIK